MLPSGDTDPSWGMKTAGARRRGKWSTTSSGGVKLSLGLFFEKEGGQGKKGNWQ